MDTTNVKAEDNAAQRRLRDTFRRRSQQLAERGRQRSAREAGTPVLVLRAGEERFGIELAHVEQVFAKAEIAPVPGAATAMLGVSTLRGTARSVFALNRLVGLEGTAGELRYLVLLKFATKQLGLAVESIDGICRIRLDELMPRQSAESAEHGPVRGVTEDRIAVLEAAALFEQAARDSDNANHLRTSRSASTSAGG